MDKALHLPGYIAPVQPVRYSVLGRRAFLRGAAGTALGAGALARLSGVAGAAVPRVRHSIESIILDAYADGRSSVVVPPGSYECPISVRLAGVSGMEIIVDGVTITRARPAGDIPKTLEFWSLAGCSDLRIVGDMTITSWKPFSGSYYPLWEGHHAFGIHACERVTIEGARIRSVWGDFFYLRSQGRTRTTGRTAISGWSTSTRTTAVVIRSGCTRSMGSTWCAAPSRTGIGARSILVASTTRSWCPRTSTRRLRSRPRRGGSTPHPSRARLRRSGCGQRRRSKTLTTSTWKVCGKRSTGVAYVSW